MLRDAYLLVCTNRRPDGTPKGSCAARGSEAVHAAIKNRLAERGLATNRVRCCFSSCLDFCAEGPVVLLVPQMTVFKGVRLEDVEAIVATAEAATAEAATAGAATAGAPTAGAPTAGAPTAGAATAGATTVGAAISGETA